MSNFTLFTLKLYPLIFLQILLLLSNPFSTIAVLNIFTMLSIHYEYVASCWFGPPETTQNTTQNRTEHMTTILTESTIETLAGGFAGFCQVLVGHPFDTIKVRLLQVEFDDINHPYCRSECKLKLLIKVFYRAYLI